MILINADQVTSQLRSLFESAMPAGIRCAGVLSGILAGRIVTDDPVGPKWAIVQEATDSTIYVGGSISGETLGLCMTELCKDSDVIVGLWPDDPLINRLPARPEYDGWAIDFTDRPAGEGLDLYWARLPEGCELRRVDRTLFERLADHDSIVAAYGSVETILENRLGYCLMKGDDILCESFTSPAIGDVVEMGVMTGEPYRGRGYATLTCARVIHACEELGWQTYWNTAKQNLASVALARKLGYRCEQEYRVLAWFKSK